MSFCFEVLYSSVRKQNRGPMKIRTLAVKTLKSDEFNLTNNLNVESPLSECNKKIPHELKNVTVKCSNKIGNLTEKEVGKIYSNADYNQNKADVILTDDVVEVNYQTEKTEQEINENLELDAHQMPPLEKFEMRQKRIEAENARRRALINKAIIDKKMRTQAEAVKLAKITEELNHLDSILSADVSILRNYIEKASMEFSEAEKRYLKAEKEFVEAKLLLFDKMQRKEQLTEHLCAIIEQNENRKADKLVELMKQLEMEAIIEEYDTNGIEPILSNLCTLNDGAYHFCHTLKPLMPQTTTNIETLSTAEPQMTLSTAPEQIMINQSKHIENIAIESTEKTDIEDVLWNCDNKGEVTKAITLNVELPSSSQVV